MRFLRLACRHGRIGSMALAVSMAVTAWAMTATTVHGQDIDPVKEAQVKAGYVLNFLRYTDFPWQRDRPADAPYRIVVVGDAALASALHIAATGGVAVNARTLDVALPGGTQDLLAADLVFVGRDRSAQAPDIIRSLAGRPLLVVGDGEGFIPAGGMIGLRLEGSRIVFDAHPAAIRGAGLMLSAKVLKLARHVHPEDAP
ncbi:MAG: YfiR family protein [Panacagrimonas sp.]